MTYQTSANEGTCVFKVILLVVTYIYDVACSEKEHMCILFENKSKGLRDTMLGFYKIVSWVMKIAYIFCSNLWEVNT